MEKRKTTLLHYATQRHSKNKKSTSTIRKSLTDSKKQKTNK